MIVMTWQGCQKTLYPSLCVWFSIEFVNNAESMNKYSYLSLNQHHFH